MKYTYSFIFLVLISPAFVFGQIKLHLGDGSNLKISGTSTLHDWDMQSSQMKSEAAFLFDDDGNPQHLKSLDFSIPVKSLKSNSKRLDQNAYDALKVNIYPEIKFISSSHDIDQLNPGNYVTKIKGMLTVSGVTKEKMIEAVCKKDGENILNCTGKTSLSMTDYGVTPPSFMMGAMKTGNEITIEYKVIYKP